MAYKGIKELKQKAHDYLMKRGCLSMGQKYSAYTIENMLVEFAEQIPMCNNTKSK